MFTSLRSNLSFQKAKAGYDAAGRGLRSGMNWLKNNPKKSIGAGMAGSFAIGARTTHRDRPKYENRIGRVQGTNRTKDMEHLRAGGFSEYRANSWINKHMYY